MKHLFPTLVFIIAFGCSSNAQSVQLVKSFENRDTLPKFYNQFVEYKNKLYFTSGNYLWVSDGSRAGTNAIYGFRKADHNTANGITVLNNQLIFMADDSMHGWELWVSDGTTSGTTILSDINPGIAWGVYGRFSCNLNGDYENSIAKANGSIYFYGNDGQHGVELWRSDGTTNGTYMVKDINSFPQKGIIDTPAISDILATPNNNLFFYANDSVHGFELWVSDGTANGTKLTKDVQPGKIGAQSWCVPIQNKVLFSAAGLHITDGNNTLRIADMAIESSDKVEYNGSALFLGYSLVEGLGLAISDGTASNTKILRKIDGEPNYHNDHEINLTLYKNNVYFTGRNPDSIAEMGLWKTDGTTIGTNLVYKTVWQPHGLTAINGKLYFKVQDPSTQEVDVWESDGTTAGTKKAQNNFTKPTGSIVIGSRLVSGNFTSFKDQPYFVHWYVVPNSYMGLYRIGEPDNIIDIEEQYSASIYPNPAKNELTISAKNMTGISICNIAGMVVHEENVLGNKAVINTRA